MKTVTLSILAKDIENTRYTDYHRCAMTLALRRAGLPMHEGGGGIYYDERIWDKVCDTPPELERKVLSMYAFLDKGREHTWTIDNTPVKPIKPRNFKFKFTFDDSLIN